MLISLMREARTVIRFIPADDRPSELVAEYLDCPDLKFMLITAQTSLQVTGVLVDNEFQPVIALFERFRFLRFPVLLNPCASFGVLLQTSEAGISPDCCYWRSPVSLTISTSHGPFTFKADHLR